MVIRQLQVTAAQVNHLQLLDQQLHAAVVVAVEQVVVEHQVLAAQAVVETLVLQVQQTQAAAVVAETTFQDQTAGLA
jgi:hypothetical protein